MIVNCEEILKKYDVSYQSWNNILNRYLKERENLKDKDKKENNLNLEKYDRQMRIWGNSQFFLKNSKKLHNYLKILK